MKTPATKTTAKPMRDEAEDDVLKPALFVVEMMLAVAAVAVVTWGVMVSTTEVVIGMVLVSVPLVRTLKVVKTLVVGAGDTDTVEVVVVAPPDIAVDTTSGPTVNVPTVVDPAELVTRDVVRRGTTEPVTASVYDAVCEDDEAAAASAGEMVKAGDVE